MATLRDTSASPNRGTTTLSAGSASVDVTLPTTLLATTKSLLVFSYHFPSAQANQPQFGTITGEILSTTTLRFQRYGSTGSPAATIEWYVVEWTAGVTVQHGSTTLTVNQAVEDVPITAVDTTAAFVLSSLRNSGGTYGDDDFCSARLLDADTLRLERVATGSTTGIVCWQVVEYDACDVQSGTVTVAAGSTSNTASGSGFAGGWLIASHRAGNGAAADIGQKTFRGVVTSDTVLTFDRDHVGSTTVALTVEWQLVQFSDATTVQTGGEDFGATASTATETIAAVDAWRSVAHACGMSGSGSLCAMSSDDDLAPVLFSSALGTGSTTSLTLTRRSSVNATATVQWFVVEFDEGGGGTAHALAGNADDGADATGDIAVARSLAGTADASGDAAGDIGVARALAGNADAGADATGDIAVARSLAGNADAAGDAAGALNVARALAGAAEASEDATGDIVVARALAGTSDASGDATGDVVVARALAGNADAAGDAIGALSVTGDATLAGIADASGDATGDLAVARSLAGAAAAAGDAFGVLAIARSLTALADAGADAVGALAVARALAGAAAASGTMAGTLSLASEAAEPMWSASRPPSAWAASKPPAAWLADRPEV
ncbi:MAG TPA: hypothetical protein VD813_10085 [Pseudonocardia sp.]|nr:hypothetical protein [Pseudonocardia sp.]